MKHAGATLKKMFIWLAILAVQALFYNQAANWHFHMLSNGMVIEHAHPLKKSPVNENPYQKHQHSDLAYSILAQLSSVFVITVIGLLAMGLFMKGSFEKVTSPFVLFFSKIEPGARLLRAPPLSFV
jgi:hypothetical protein